MQEIPKEMKFLTPEQLRQISDICASSRATSCVAEELVMRSALNRAVEGVDSATIGRPHSIVIDTLKQEGFTVANYRGTWGWVTIGWGKK